MALDEGKEALAVSVLDGEPERILKMPEDTTAPFWLTVAAAVLFTGLLLHAWWLAGIGGVGVILALMAWNWPRRKLLEREPVSHEGVRRD
jgi:cytochrome c oxidase subunit 1/cytochrome c oxidase subunit I+III